LKVAGRVRQLAKLALTDYSTRTGFYTRSGWKAIQSLALMQALPYLDGTTDPKYQEVRKVAGALSDDVIRIALPEYWEEFGPKGSDGKLRTPAGADRSVLKVRDALEPDMTTYALSVILMMIEYRLAGGLDAPAGSALPGRGAGADRSGRLSVPAPPSARKGVAHLAAGLLAQKGVAEFPVTPQPGALWGYNTFGSGGIAGTCYSQSSSAVFGLRAAWNVLGPPDTLDPALLPFDIADGDHKVDAANYRNAWADALFHSFLYTTEIPHPTGLVKPEDVLGVTGADGFGDIPPEKRTQASLPSPLPDVSRYRTSYLAAGQTTFYQIAYDPSRSGLPVGEAVAFYRYHPRGAKEPCFAAYHTSGGAYVNAVSANLYESMLLRLSPGAVVGGSYKATRAGADRWTVGAPGGRSFRVGRKPDDGSWRYTRLKVVDEATSNEVPVDARVAASLNGVIALMARVKDPAAAAPSWSINGTPDTDQPWRKALTLTDGDYSKVFLGMASYGVMKACIATGHYDALGPWRWRSDLVGALCEAKDLVDEKQGVYANVYFGILTLTNAYRPTFPRSEGTITP
jgi:hypothetical protein